MPKSAGSKRCDRRMREARSRGRDLSRGGATNNGMAAYCRSLRRESKRGCHNSPVFCSPNGEAYGGISPGKTKEDILHECTLRRIRFVRRLPWRTTVSDTNDAHPLRIRPTPPRERSSLASKPRCRATEACGACIHPTGFLLYGAIPYRGRIIFADGRKRRRSHSIPDRNML